MAFLIFAILALVFLGGIFSVYFIFGPGLLVEAPAYADWGDYGSFFGGIATPVLLFVAILLIIHIMRQQSRHLQSVFSEGKKLDLMRFLSNIDDEIAHLLNRPLQMEDKRKIDFGDLISDMARSSGVRDPAYKPAMNKLLKLTSSYCEAIGSAREHINDHFVLSLHYRKAKDVLRYLEKNPSTLHPMARQALTYCKMHLEGKPIKN